MNEKEVIIILPGFEYQRYGTLTIDQVKITAYVNNIKTSIWYLDTANKEYLSTDELVLSKTVEHLLDDNSIYPDTSYLYAQLSENFKRVPNGYFYSLDKNNIYTLSVFNDYVEYLNCNNFLHDGLGFIKLENINSNIQFVVKFYSRIDIDTNTDEDDNNYVLIDTKTYYYNPLINNSQTSLTISKTEAVKLKYDNTKEEDVNIKLNDNVILFQIPKDGPYQDKKLHIKWNNTEYKRTTTEVIPEHLQLYSYPYVIFNKDNFDSTGLEYGFSISRENDVIFFPNIEQLVSSNYPTKVTPILYSVKQDNLNNLYAQCNNQKNFFLKEENELKIKAEELHKYGVYYTNLGKRNQTWGLIKNQDTGNFDYHFFDKDSPIKVKYMAGYNNQGLQDNYKTPGIDYGNYDYYNDWYHRSYLYSDKDGDHCKNPNKEQIHQLTFRCLGNEESPNCSPSLVSSTTKYQFMDKNYVFNYLYKQDPYISIHNISQESPLRLQYYDYDTFNLKEQPLDLPDGFIGVGSSKQVPLSDKSIEWKWNLYDRNGIEGGESFIFPNYILAVNYDESYLSLSNTSDYSVIPQLSLTDNNDNPQGFYNNALVESNIINNNLLNIGEEKGINTNGFCAFPAYINKDFKFNINIENDGYYIFNMNGCITSDALNIYVLKINDLEINISYDNPSVLLYIPKGNYDISLNVHNGIKSPLYITSLGLYELNLEDPGINTVLLKKHLEDLKLDTLYYIPNEDKLYDYIIFQAAYVYQENNVECYKQIRSTIYPPNNAIQKPIGVYNINNYTAEIVNKENVTDKYKLLGYFPVENDDCKKTIEAITVKIA